MRSTGRNTVAGDANVKIGRSVQRTLRKVVHVLIIYNGIAIHRWI